MLSNSAVDINDHDSAENTVSIRTTRWYLRVFFWICDRAIFTCYNVVVYVAASGIKKEWEKYQDKNGGRKKFQIDLGLSLIEHGIRMDWNAPYDETAKPRWMRQHEYVACNSNACFFCKERKTTGIRSRPRTGTPSKKIKKEPACDGERIDLGKSGGRYCQACYRKRRDTHSKTEKSAASTKSVNIQDWGVAIARRVYL